ncbi:MAG TPA: M64 family metallopeptidase, partial [Candidatus Sulfotelmatobacter sp.]|nr:M64 family metallopeptidase [Candidatus Sulfotelmatobacter sp.]
MLVVRSCWLLLLLWWGPLLCACAQTSIQTLLTNGPVLNRFNIVVLSEGYTADQLPQFRTDAANAVTSLLAHAPYQEYQGYVNAFALSVPSIQSGSDHPAKGIYRNTYFNSFYSDYLITMPTNSAGQGKVDALLKSYLPQCHLAILLVNEPFYDGGSDGFAKTAIVSVSPMSAEILAHETGHVVAGLGDEYTDAYPGFPDLEEPNTTRETRPGFIKWKAWIPTNTPIPTPETYDYSTAIGLFQGAHYHTAHWYRPKLDCAMRSQYVPFCEVCSEALVLSVYKKVR